MKILFFLIYFWRNHFFSISLKHQIFIFLFFYTEIHGPQAFMNWTWAGLIWWAKPVKICHGAEPHRIFSYLPSTESRECDLQRVKPSWPSLSSPILPSTVDAHNVGSVDGAVKSSFLHCTKLFSAPKIGMRVV